MKAIIFDVDGTLVDSVDLHARSWQEAFKEFGHPVSFEDVRSQIGKGTDQLLPVFLSKTELDEQAEKLEKYRGEQFKKNYLSQVKGFPEVRRLFELLLADGWKIALASSAKGSELQTYKKLAQISDLLDAETSSDDAEKSKPFPDIFQAAVSRLGVPADECFVVGDSPYDAQAASKAGIRSIGFLCGGFPEKDLREAGFEILYKDAADVVSEFDRSIFHRERPKK